jgi:hypothetical protein
MTYGVIQSHNGDKLKSKNSKITQFQIILSLLLLRPESHMPIKYGALVQNAILLKTKAGGKNKHYMFQ